ncbi:hypothetical protein J6590_071726 [Homalodisca vitripennis]|nr:hypothetical protein J6590_071726 [Homalodisca vitripennis]
MIYKSGRYAKNLISVKTQVRTSKWLKIRAKKSSLTWGPTTALKVTSEPPPVVGQADCLQGQDCSASTHPSSSHDRCLIWSLAITVEPAVMARVSCGDS